MMDLKSMWEVFRGNRPWDAKGNSINNVYGRNEHVAFISSAPSFQDAYDWLKNNGDHGTIIIDEDITISSKPSIDDAGFYLTIRGIGGSSYGWEFPKITKGFNGNLFEVGVANYDKYLILENFSIAGNGSNYTGQGIHSEGIPLIMKNVGIKNCGGDGINITYGNYSRFNNIQSEANNGAGLHAETLNGVLIDGGRYSNSTGTNNGIELVSGSSWKIIGATIEGNTDNGIKLTSSARGLISAYFEDNANFGVLLSGSAQVTSISSHFFRSTQGGRAFYTASINEKLVSINDYINNYDWDYYIGATDAPVIIINPTQTNIANTRATYQYCDFILSSQWDGLRAENMFMKDMPSGTDQASAGASTGQIWHDTTDNTIKIGI